MSVPGSVTQGAGPTGLSRPCAHLFLEGRDGTVGVDLQRHMGRGRSVFNCDLQPGPEWRAEGWWGTWEAGRVGEGQVPGLT